MHLRDDRQSMINSALREKDDEVKQNKKTISISMEYVYSFLIYKDFPSTSTT
jgi:hypothetical protein